MTLPTVSFSCRDPGGEDRSNLLRGALLTGRRAIDPVVFTSPGLTATFGVQAGGRSRAHTAGLPIYQDAYRRAFKQEPRDVMTGPRPESERLV